MRTFLQILISIVLLAIAVFLMLKIKGLGDKERPKPKPVVKTVFVDTVRNTTIPIVIEANGNLEAKRRLEIYTEVQGILKSGSKLFKPGQAYRKGETLLRLDAQEFQASLQAQKSAFINQITAILPDLRLDFPEVFPKWERYVNAIDVNSNLPEFPEMQTDQERYFITGRNLLSTYYTIKNLEQRLAKYRVTAPFTGILTEATVSEGTLVRSGQKLGEFIGTGSYELPVAVNKSYANLLKVGKSVTVTNLDNSKEYEGRIVRINGNIDQATQTVIAFIAVNDSDLREGMYLEAQLNARSEENAIEINRNLLQTNNQVFVVKDTILDLIDVNPVYFSETKAVVKDITNNTLLVSKTVPGAYAGMRVQIYRETQSAPAQQSNN